MASPATTSGRRPHGDALQVLIAIGALYVTYGIIGGLVQGGLPPVLRTLGFDVGTSALIYVLYLPFGLMFLWAPAVDRFSLPFLTPCVGWIVAMQTIVIIGLGCIAFAGALSPTALFGIALIIAFAAATMDISLDALAVETIRPEHRPMAAASKLAALASGSMIGGGVFLGLFNRLGWQSTFLLLVALIAVATAPILLLRGHDRSIDRGGRPRASLILTLRRGRMATRLLLLCLACCVIFPLSGLNRIMLVDLGVPLDRIGWIVGTLAPLAMLAASAAAAPLMHRLGYRGTIVAFAGVCLAAAGTMIAGYGWRDAMIAVIGTIGAGAGAGGIYVVLAAVVLGWASGSQPATDYSALFGISRLTSTIATIAAGQVIGLTGWIPFYCAASILLVAVVALLVRLVPTFEQPSPRLSATP